METQQQEEQRGMTETHFLTSQTVSKIVSALARAQGKYKPLVKNCEGKVNYQEKEGRSAGGYTFRYADLGAVIEATSEALSSEELVHTAQIGAGKIRVTLLHSSGEWMASEAPLPSPGEVGVQKFGGWVTYLRRYLLAPLLGVASEDDNDGNAAQGNHFSKETKPAPASKPATPAPKAASPKTPATVADLLARLTELKIEGKEVVLTWMTTNVGHEVKATKELKPEEIEKLLWLANKIQPSEKAA